MKSFFIGLAILVIQISTAVAQTTVPDHRYSGTHAGGPANDLIPSGKPQPVEPHETSEAYRYSGPHSGGPANALIPNGTPQVIQPRQSAPAYRYSGLMPADQRTIYLATDRSV